MRTASMLTALMRTALPSGVRWGATQQSRVLATRLASALGVAGISVGARGRRALVAASWVSACLSCLAGALVDPARRLPLISSAFAAWWPTLLIGVGLAAVLSARSHTVRLLGRHRQLLSSGGSRATGLVIGLSAPDYPILIVIGAQAARLATPSGAWLVLAVLLAIVIPPLRAAGRSATRTGRTPWLPAVLAGIAMLIHATERLLHTPGHRWPSIVPSHGWAVLAAAACTAVVGASTMLAAHWLGRRRLAPRSTRMDRQAASIVMTAVATSWAVQFVLETVGRTDFVPAVPLLTSFIAALLLRTRLARYLSPEARGYGLFLLRDVAGAGGRVLRWYALNAVLLLAPTMAVAAFQLLMAGAPATGLLLATLFAVEVVGDVVVVQRKTVVLPAGRLDEIGLTSRSGLASAGCFAVAVTAVGVVGFNTPFQFSNVTSVASVSALLAGTAALLAILAHLDTPGWLNGLSATRVELMQ
ncbi:hypothetical protein SAMN05443377_10389 [Propionibacterium cyclohexanicum]|uniref:Uncharacterized protein n=1 Tax=Propionibacterium cyclohexanicum TaxID=64702 RepID=A0A1H9QFR4_9ACTN|nr:hypothetical protein [Propionibacterium cyclohexanicum]SER59391.1 hypothetical protein SAMN05443377_10389 [Propionibacterium cyclohexanicum]